MTIPASAKGFGLRLPSSDEKKAANQLRRVLATQMEGGATLKLSHDDSVTVEVVLTPALSGLLIDFLRHVGNGEAVALVPVNRMLTTQQAADILNVSRPFLVSLLEKGDIDHELVGRHRRVKAEDLFAYKHARNERRGKALGDLAEIDADLI